MTKAAFCTCVSTSGSLWPTSSAQNCSTRAGGGLWSSRRKCVRVSCGESGWPSRYRTAISASPCGWMYSVGHLSARGRLSRLRRNLLASSVCWSPPGVCRWSPDQISKQVRCENPTTQSPTTWANYLRSAELAKATDTMQDRNSQARTRLFSNHNQQGTLSSGFSCWNSSARLGLEGENAHAKSMQKWIETHRLKSIASNFIFQVQNMPVMQVNDEFIPQSSKQIQLQFQPRVSV